jgi:microcystin-dependent protein
VSRNQAGNYTLPLPPVVPGEVIESQWANVTTADLAEGLTQSLDRSGRGAMLAPLILSSDPITQPFQATSKAYVDQFLAYATGMPIAAITAYAANGAIPPGWLLCDGQAVSRTTYPELFTAIGTIYGNGDNSTTFNVPNLTNEFIRGFGAGRTLGVAQSGAILAHTHAVSITSGNVSADHTHPFSTGAMSQNASHGHPITDAGHAHGYTTLTAGTGTAAGSGIAQTAASSTTTVGTGIGIVEVSTDHIHSGTTGGISTNHTHIVAGATASTGGGENIPRNMPMFYIIKATKDSTSSDTVVTVTVGVVAPATAPPFIGAMYVDSVANKVYVATGTAASTDWSLLN